MTAPGQELDDAAPTPVAGTPTSGSAYAPEALSIDPRFHSLPQLFQDQVRRRALSPALYTKIGSSWRPISWEQYGQAVKRVTGYLLREGLRAGDRVGILSFNRAEWHIADLATLHAGGTVVGIYTTNSPSQVQYILEHSEAPVVFVEHRDQLAKILTIKEQLPALRRAVLMTGETQAGDPNWVTTWAAVLAAGEEYDRDNLGEFDRRWQAVKPGDLATFIYTSGTTGPPKAVMLDHSNLLFTAESLVHCTTLSDPDKDVTISYLPLAHIAERMAGHVLHLRVGHSVYFAENLAALAGNVREVRPTFMFGVPRIWEKFQGAVEKQLAETHGVKGAISRWAMRKGYAAVDTTSAGGTASGFGHRLADRLVLAKIRSAVGLDRAEGLSTGAAPISESTLRFFWAIGLSLYEVYGQSEGSGPTSTNRPGHTRLGTVGPPIPGEEVLLAADGEVLVRGGNVFKGYFKDDAATSEALDADGYLHSGDVGVIDARGFLTITDRKKDLIITAGGKNISPSNIEVALKRQPYVGNAIAIGDRRPFMSALLTIDAEQVPALAEAVGAAPDIAALSTNDRVRAIFQAGVDAVNANLANVEMIKKFVILPSDLSVDGGELTPTLKVKRKVVGEKYAAQIEGLYSGGARD